jgi:NodT family efflux transporter outer membrane factor (OMF) lipoprotein
MRRTGAFALLLLLGACVPEGVVPQQAEISASTLGLGNALAPSIDAQWWKAFGDPALDTAVAEALAHNPGLGEALARLRAAKASVASANSALYPQVNFDAQENRDRLSDIYLYPPPYAGTFRWLGTIDADLTWNIDFWGKEKDQLDKAKSLRGAAALDAAAARLAIAGAMAQAFIDLDRAWKLADIAERTETERRETLALTLRRVKDGLDSQVEEQEARALLAQARENRTAADSNRDIIVHEIAALEGHGADAYAKIGRPVLSLDATLPLPERLPADMLARRPDVLAARARIDAALAGRSYAQAGFYPDVDLAASAGWAAIGLSPLFRGASQQYGGGPAIHLPLFDAGRLRAEYAGATADLDYNGVLDGAVRQAADALTRIRALEAERAQRREMLAAAEKGFRLAQTRYRSGLKGQISVLGAQNVVLEARQGDVALAADSAVQRVNLLLAVGGGFTPPAPDDSHQDILKP